MNCPNSPDPTPQYPWAWNGGQPPILRPPPPTSGIAVAAFILSLLIAPLGIILGHIARAQMKRTGEAGGGLATAALLIGYLFTVPLVVLLIATVAAKGHSNSSQSVTITGITPTTEMSPSVVGPYVTIQNGEMLPKSRVGRGQVHGSACGTFTVVNNDSVPYHLVNDMEQLSGYVIDVTVQAHSSTTFKMPDASTVVLVCDASRTCGQGVLVDLATSIYISDSC